MQDIAILCIVVIEVFTCMTFIFRKQENIFSQVSLHVEARLSSSGRARGNCQ